MKSFFPSQRQRQKHALVGGFGKPERGAFTFDSDLIVRMRNDGDTAVVRLVTEKSATTLKNGSFHITVTGLRHNSA